MGGVMGGSSGRYRVAAVGILGAGFAAGNAFGGDSGSGGGKHVVGGDDLKPVADSRALKPVASCDDLLEHYVDAALERVTAWGWDGPTYRDHLYRLDDLQRSDGLAAEAAPATPKAAESSETGTNVQEAGVDEPDVVKTNGESLVRIEGGRLTTYDVSGTTPSGSAPSAYPESTRARSCWSAPGSWCSTARSRASGRPPRPRS